MSVKVCSSKVKRKYSGDESVELKGTQQDWYDEILDNFRADASLKVIQEDYLLDGTLIWIGCFEAHLRRSLAVYQSFYLQNRYRVDRSARLGQALVSYVWRTGCMEE